MRIFMLLTLLCSTLWLSGCGPSYRTYTFYEPPTNEQGKNCTFGCEQTRNTCESECQEEYDDCFHEARLQGKIDYLEAKEDWLEAHARCSKLKAQVKGENACSEREPSQSHFIKTHHCRRDCGCENTFERCFQLCGGQIRYERRCVSGCEGLTQVTQ